MSKRFRGHPIGQFVFDQYHDAFKDDALENTHLLEKKLLEAFSYFFEEAADQLGDDQTGPKVAEMGYEWEPNTEEWEARKGQSRGKFGVGLKGLLRANINRLNPVKAYGKPKVALENADGTFTYGKVNTKSPARIGFIAFPKVGRAPSKLIAVFSARQQKILRYNEPIARKGDTHARPFLYPMFRYYMEQELPAVFEEPV